MSNSGPRTVSFKMMERLIIKDQVEWEIKCIIMPTGIEQLKRVYQVMMLRF